MEKEKLVSIGFYAVRPQKPFRFKKRWWKKIHFNKGVALDKSKDYVVINLGGIVGIPKADLDPIDVGEIVNEI